MRRQLDLVATVGARTFDEHLSLRVPAAAHDRMAALLEGLPGRRVAEHVLPHGGLRVTLRVLDLG